MKKIVFIAALVSIFNFQFSICQAQFGDYGVKVGFGMATIEDNLSTKSPIVGMNFGGFINYTFVESESVLAEIFYLQSGLNFIRRGNTFEEKLENNNILAYRSGYNHAWYAQIPILACVHMELPLRQSGHIVGLYLGPAINVGLFGVHHDRMFSHSTPSLLANYDNSIEGSGPSRAVFDGHFGRIDVSAIVGLTYEYSNFVFSLYVEHGFVAAMHEDDIIRILEKAVTNSDDINPVIPNGNNAAYMFSVSYKLGNISK